MGVNELNGLYAKTVSTKISLIVKIMVL